VLKSIDVLIGLVVVLLALSMAVTVITQSITTIINSRGRHLRRGLIDLLQQLDPKLTETVSEAVATRLLTHPLVCGSNTPLAAGAGFVRRALGGRRLGNVVHREEFTKLLMLLATDDSTGLDTVTVNALQDALTTNGIADPKAKLKEIRMAALRLEQMNPEVSHVVRQNVAILQQAESDFVAKINNWFDQTMDRTSQRFTASTRAITFAGAFIVAIGLQVDALSLVNRLSADDKLREAFVSEAIKINNAGPSGTAQQNGGAANTAAVQPAAPPVAPAEQDANKPADTQAADDKAAPDAENAKAQEYRAFLAEYGVIKLPSAGPWEWWESLKNANYMGLLITALLLSLGAPFWYSALSGLLQLRSALAVKDDSQRKERQSSDKPRSTGAAPPVVGGERGDMQAVG